MVNLFKDDIPETLNPQMVPYNLGALQANLEPSVPSGSRKAECGRSLMRVAII